MAENHIFITHITHIQCLIFHGNIIYSNYSAQFILNIILAFTIQRAGNIKKYISNSFTVTLFTCLIAHTWILLNSQTIHMCHNNYVRENCHNYVGSSVDVPCEVDQMHIQGKGLWETNNFIYLGLHSLWIFIFWCLYMFNILSKSALLNIAQVRLSLHGVRESCLSWTIVLAMKMLCLYNRLHVSVQKYHSCVVLVVKRKYIES